MRSLLCCFVAVAALTVIYADGQLPTLDIQPKGPIMTKPVDESLALTCKPSILDPKLITQLEWKDPRQKRIERIDNINPKSLLYVQKLADETGIMLIFTKLAEHHAGEYTCSAKYSNTETIQASINVSTIIDITWVDAPELQPAVLGKDYLIRCNVVANPPPEINWIRNNERIISEGRYVVKSKGLLIKNVKESDDGTYTCRAVVLVTGNIKERNINVQVQVPPLVEEMKEVSIIEGEQASIQCKASGKPPPEYKWIKEPDRKDLAVTDRFQVNKNTGLLIINKAEYNDNAIYKCIAKNLAGTAETPVRINVLVKPKIFEFWNITTEIIKDTKIMCKASGRPTPTIVFRKLSLKDAYTIGEQVNDNRIVIEQNPNESKGENIGTLKIFGVNRTDDGLYECISENKVGTAYKNGHITVHFPPTFEATKDYPPVWTWNNRPGNLSCIAEAIPNATIKWKVFDIEIGDSNPNLKIIGRGPQSNLIVQPFAETRLFTTYECIAENVLGSASKLIQLRKASVPRHVKQVSRISLTATTVKFNIVGPETENGLPLRAYVVQYQTEREHMWERAMNRTWSIDAPYVIENLQPVETYNFRFAAKNDVGLSGFDALHQITMPRQSVPAEPKILASNLFENNTRDFVANSPYADHFELRWNVPNDNGDPIDSYLIRYCVSKRVNGEWRDSDSECSTEITQSFEYTSYELNQLQADTTYKIELRAHNSIGPSLPAQIRVKTARGVDSTTIPYDPPAISSTMIIGIVIGAVILLLVIVDVTCFCVNRAGIIAILCYRSKPIDDEDPKLGSDEKEPLSPENIDNSHLINGEKRNISVEFDGTRVYSKPVTEIGRHSAV